VFARLMGLKTVSPRELHELVRSKAVTPVDVNPRRRWLAARVPGALNLDPASYRDADLPADRDSPLVFYCSAHLCIKAPLAARRAIGMGYRNVRVMSAGIAGWLGADLPTESGAPGS
jgi:rhodanese-related sulfurtransferase